jgi:hypothetical protein
MTLSQTNSVPASAIDQEQLYIDMLYRLLDEARDRAGDALTQTLGSGGAGGTFQARLERDFTAVEQSRRLAQLNAVEHGLCFGRTDSEPTADRAGTLYIGRIGLRDDEHEPRLIDWRAPAAHPFYAATPRDPNGLIRRRHIYTRNRTVTGVDDDVFDLDRLSEPDRRSLSGEAMLIASITSRRTGRMSDVVATIQAEQDRVIRSALQGVLVVQGGPSRRCTGPRTCSTPTGARSSAAACSSSGRTPPSSATSARSCRPWARPTWCSARSPSSSAASRPRPTTIRKPPWSRATPGW